MDADVVRVAADVITDVADVVVAYVVVTVSCAATGIEKPVQQKL